MKNWEFGKIQGNEIAIGDRLSDMMGVVEGGYVYSTLFEYNDKGPKKYELILSMYPQENYRTLSNITLYMKDVPGASAQAGKFLGKRGINILNSISLDGISDTIIIWKMLADLNFAGELGILRETFESLKSANDPSVSFIEQLEIKPADIGRVFRTEANLNKTELRRGAPITVKNGRYDISTEYGDLLGNMDGQNILLVADIGSWIMSVTFFKEKTSLRKIKIEIPDCPGSIAQCMTWIAEQDINLISVFSKIKICYQTMIVDIVADFADCDMGKDEFESSLRNVFDKMNGIFTLKQFDELK